MIKNLNYIKQLDGFRFIAVAGVMITHLVEPSGPVLSKIPFGSGVNLFFVISGFLITTILFQLKENLTETTGTKLKNFYIKRALRIFPIYYLTLIFLVIIGFQNYKEVTNWMLLYGANIWISLNKPSLGAYNHLWSLSVEEQFYLVWPFIIFIVSKKHMKHLIIGAITISILYKVFLYFIVGHGWWIPAISSSSISSMDILAFGALLAYYVRYENENYQRHFLNKWILLFVLLFYLFTITFPLFPDQAWIKAIFFNTFFSVLAMFILAPAVTDRYKGIINKALQNKVIVHFGKISYGLYLYHLFMPSLYYYLISLRIIPLLNEPMRICFHFVVCIIIAELSWFVIERPILKLKNRFQSQNITAESLAISQPDR